MKDKMKVLAAIDRVFGRKTEKYRNVKNLLSEARIQEQKMDTLERQVFVTENTLGPATAKLGGISCGCYVSSSLEMRLIQLDELREKRQAERRLYSQKRKKVEMLVRQLPKKVQQEIITRHYIEARPLDLIAEELSTSLRNVQNIHSASLKFLDQCLKEDGYFAHPTGCSSNK